MLIVVKRGCDGHKECKSLYVSKKSASGVFGRWDISAKTSIDSTLYKDTASTLNSTWQEGALQSPSTGDRRSSGPSIDHYLPL